MENNSGGALTSSDAAVERTLQDLMVDSAKRREKVVLDIPAEVRTDPRVIRQLHLIAGTDPVEYVRLAARKQLLSVGEIPAGAVEPPKVKNEGIGGIVGVVLTCVALLICVPVFVIGVLAILGPQIGNVLSRVTSGLSGTP